MKIFCYLRYFLIIVVICINLICNCIYVQAQTKESEPPKETELYAQAAVLIDGDCGRILYGKNETDCMPMASTTKIMTCILALEYGDLDDIVEVSSYAASMPDVQLNIVQGEQCRLGDLLYSLMLESHNDTAVAIAEYIATKSFGLTDTISERDLQKSKDVVLQFADLMNKKALEIGCTSTNFVTPNGLDADREIVMQDGTSKVVSHSTTAYDLALIMRYCVLQSEQKENFMKIMQTSSYSFTDCTGTKNYSCNNHNALLSMMDGVLAGKTGFTNKAGYCYVGAVKQDDKYFIAVVLACGWPPNKTNKWADIKRLISYGENNYQYQEITIKELFSHCIQVQGGDVEKTEVTVNNINSAKVKLLMKIDKSENVRIIHYMQGVLQAPVISGQEVGEVRCYIGDTLLQKWSIITVNPVLAEKNWF